MQLSVMLQYYSNMVINNCSKANAQVQAVSVTWFNQGLSLCVVTCMSFSITYEQLQTEEVL